MKRAILFASLAFAAMLMLPAASSAKLPGLLTLLGSNQFAVRPSVIGYTGDGTGYIGGSEGRGRINGKNEFGHIAWLTWTNQAATGTGALWIDTGVPNDAEGTFSSVPVKLRAFAPRDGHFTRLTSRYTESGENIILERGVRFLSLPDHKGFYEYYVVRAVREYHA
jgi:hypothetical protein